MNHNQQLIKLYLTETLDILVNVKNDKYILSNLNEIIIKYVAARLPNHIPYYIDEFVVEVGLLELYEFSFVGKEGVFSPLPVNGLPTDIQEITKDFNNVKYLVERLGKDKTNVSWLLPINDWIEAVSDFRFANKNTGEIFDEYINLLSSIFVRKVLNVLAVKYGFMAFGKDVIEVIERFNELHPNMINMMKIKKESKKDWMEKYKGGLAEMLPTQPSPLDEAVITCAGDLFPRGDYQATDASIITKALYLLLVARNIEFSDGEFKMATSNFSVGTIFISMDATEDTRKKSITKGHMVYKVMHAMIGYLLNTPPNEGYRLKVSGAEILEHLGQLYPHDAKGGRLTKEIGLNELAEALRLLEGLRISTTLIESRTKNKHKWRVDRSALFDISYRLKGQGNILDPDDINPVTDIELIYMAGDWFKYLHTQDRNYHNNIGYIHKDALSSNEYYGQLLLWLTHELEYHPGGDFKIRTILSGSGYRELVKSLLSDYNKDRALTLFKTFSAALQKIKAVDSPYPFYYRNPPTWLRLETRKPNGWFCKWLDVVIVFEKPECLLKQIEQVEKPVKPKNPLVIDVTAKKVEDTSPPNDLESLEVRLAETKVSKRAISEYLGKRHDWLSWQIRKGNLTKKDFNNIYNAISVLSKKK